MNDYHAALGKTVFFQFKMAEQKYNLQLVSEDDVSTTK